MAGSLLGSPSKGRSRAPASASTAQPVVRLGSAAESSAGGGATAIVPADAANGFELGVSPIVETALGAQLRAIQPSLAAGALRGMNEAERLRFQRVRRSEWAVQCLPLPAQARIMDGKERGSSSGARPTAQRLAMVAAALADSVSGDGAALRPKMVVMADLADFMSAIGGEHDIFSNRVAPVDVASFLLDVRKRAASRGNFGAAAATLSKLRFAVDHLGLNAPDLSSDIVVAQTGSAQSMAAAAAAEAGDDEPEEVRTRHAGTIPLRLLAGREALSNACEGRGPQDLTHPVWVHSCSRIIAFIFGLRTKELRSAQLHGADDERVIRISFHPKGDSENPRVYATRWAFGVLGPFRWWPAYREIMMGRRTLVPAISTGRVTTSTALRDGVAATSAKIVVELNELPTYGISSAARASLDVTPHSDHGSMSDVIGYFGTPLGFDVSNDRLVAGHWLGGAPSQGAGGVAPARASRSATEAARRAGADAGRRDAGRTAMPARYAEGDNRLTEARAGREVTWRVLAVAYYALRQLDGGWQSLPDTGGWDAALSFGLRAKEAGFPTQVVGDPPFSSPPFGVPAS